MLRTALIATGLTLFVLASLDLLERRMFLNGVNKILTINCSTSAPDVNRIQKILEEKKIFIVSVSYEHDYEANLSVITYKVNVKSISLYNGLFSALRELGYVSKIQMFA